MTALGKMRRLVSPFHHAPMADNFQEFTYFRIPDKELLSSGRSPNGRWSLPSPPALKKEPCHGLRPKKTARVRSGFVCGPPFHSPAEDAMEKASTSSRGRRSASNPSRRRTSPPEGPNPVQSLRRTPRSRNRSPLSRHSRTSRLGEARRKGPSPGTMAHPAPKSSERRDNFPSGR